MEHETGEREMIKQDRIKQDRIGYDDEDHGQAQEQERGGYSLIIYNWNKD